MSVSQEGILAIAYRSIDERWGRRERRAIRSAITESLLADLLRLRVGASTSSWALSRNHAGKPTLTNTAGAIRVSLSHSHLFALAAISDLGEIGVDVEVRDPSRSMSEIASYAFGPQEQRVVKSDGPRAFYRIWTLREAFAKARGLGFSILADGRDYFPEAPDSGIWQATIDGGRWLFSTGDLPGDCAVAVAITPQSPISNNRQRDLIPRELSRSGT